MRTESFFFFILFYLVGKNGARVGQERDGLI
jgi:hypothetical protein